MARRVLVACIAAAAAHAVVGVANLAPADVCAAGGACPGDHALLQARASRGRLELAREGAVQEPGGLPVSPCPAASPLSDIGGKSIYLILVDRFARSDGNETECNFEDNNWCNGTINGITEHLDYIQGMGFDCMWLTPVVKQFEGQDNVSGYASHGYWAYDWYEIDPHFGTKEDLRRLSDELHKRGMCFVYDFVVNHVGPIHSEADVARVRPFNKTEYYHTLNISEWGNNFTTYSEKFSDWPPAVQGIWSGAQCTVNASCACYKCPYEVGFGGVCNESLQFDPESPCPKDPTFPFCMAGDWECAGYNETVTQMGWFYDLGDLNHEHPFVRDELLRWGRHMVETFGIDAVRLDTASYVPRWFLSELQESVCVPVLGEATVTNLTFHAQLEADPPPSGRPVLKGVLNFPLTYAAYPGFCGPFPGEIWPLAQGNLTYLGQRMREQLTGGLYADLDTLANQVDNHDMQRIAEICNQDMYLIMNLITWNMLSKGAPTIYYGTEVAETKQRNSLWQRGWKTRTPLYKFIARLNKVRKDYGLSVASSVVANATEHTLVFQRGDVWVYLNNYGKEAASVAYGANPPDAPWGKRWVDILDDNKPARFDENGRFLSRHSLPSVLALAEGFCRGKFCWGKGAAHIEGAPGTVQEGAAFEPGPPPRSGEAETAATQ